ncbi:hypothetical protein [Sporomusa sphaeroides]|uniref:Uncharacterized protein n=1 Tax=Sporomusa sphaeroides DSM 2875 TaxID=1337886 RepID=A0ABP2C271_9FIRM|nr:hypothetical protein [Sporomusa sphaeroides]OLS57436.1 hypothetical protein SPSPH_09520 [Sporomusa sphaeroides DSM 2875]CVK18000.1 hypothetical protein SSPH_00636 [Sporomusa sphaeroides DSM 2875]
MLNEYRVGQGTCPLVPLSDETVLTAQVAGNFVGSPVSLDFHFAIQAGKLAGWPLILPAIKPSRMITLILWTLTGYFLQF